jgi:hypothetical protein
MAEEPARPLLQHFYHFHQSYYTRAVIGDPAVSSRAQRRASERYAKKQELKQQKQQQKKT